MYLKVLGLVSRSSEGGKDGSSCHEGDCEPKKSNRVAAIIGGTLSGVIFLLLVAGVVFYTRRRRRLQTKEKQGAREEIDLAPPSEPVDGKEFKPEPFPIDRAHSKMAEASHNPSRRKSAYDHPPPGLSLPSDAITEEATVEPRPSTSSITRTKTHTRLRSSGQLVLVTPLSEDEPIASTSSQLDSPSRRSFRTASAIDVYEYGDGIASLETHSDAQEELARLRAENQLLHGMLSSRSDSTPPAYVATPHDST